MFTGIVQQVGRVLALDGGVLRVSAYAPPEDWWVIGESVAVNGCCLTVATADEALRFDLSSETLARTNLSDLVEGSPVNIERAMKLGDRFGGHIVQGHVDTVGEFVGSNAGEFSFQLPAEGDRYLIDKGSIAIDGISLTVIQPEKGRFRVAVIPHTLSETNLGSRRPGDKVNIEYDVIAKHIEKLVSRG